MRDEKPMYRWRDMSIEQRAEALANRQRQYLRWHGPPHYESDTGLYLISAACYDHEPIIGKSPDRMAAFKAELLTVVDKTCERIFAWVILPNHYHILVRCADIHTFLAALGRIHGGTSFRWNGEENRRGRKVWHRAAETAMKSERHFWATLNYVLNNPVRHGYVERWQDWPYCNAARYLEEIGRDEAERRWREYPLLDFGKDWDPPEL